MDDSTQGAAQSDPTRSVQAELDQLRVSNQRDVQRMWELLMQPLGFRATSLWVSFIGADDRPTRLLLEVAESEELPDPEMVGNLFGVLEQVGAEDGMGDGVAFLITRPGRDGISAFDRSLATRLLRGAAGSSLRCYPVHVANDVAILALAPDDLAA